MEPRTVTRSIHLDVSADDLWDALADADHWPAWLGIADGMNVRPGGAGSVVEADGTRRRLVVDRVDHGERLVWRWWPEDDGAGGGGGPSQGSTVELVVAPVAGGGGSRLTVTERLSASAGPGSQESAAWGWDVRLVHLAVLLLLLSAAAHLAR